MSADDVRSHLKTYWAIGGTLLVLTGVTVGVSYMTLGVAAAVAVALLVATVKGSMVAAVFMHLNNEKTVIYRVLALTVVFFVVLMSVPTGWVTTDMSRGVQKVFTNEVPASRAHADEGHGGGHGGH